MPKSIGCGFLTHQVDAGFNTDKQIMSVRKNEWALIITLETIRLYRPFMKLLSIAL